MKVPDEISLMSLFECNPKLLDEGIPFFYNESTYRFSNTNNEDFLVVICPSYGDIKVQVTIRDVSLMITINSSPPILAIIESSVKLSFNILEAFTSNLSPNSWPMVSLVIFKLSKSQNLYPYCF